MTILTRILHRITDHKGPSLLEPFAPSYVEIGRGRAPRKGSLDERLFRALSKRLDPFYMEEDGL